MQSILRSRYQSLSLADAVGKILHATETIMLRESVKPHERERIKEALGVLLPHEARTMPTNKKQVDYERLLQKLYDAGGPQLVVVCVVGLGRSVILSLREQVKLHLPGEIKKHEETWNTPLLLSLAQDCWIEVQPHAQTDSTALPVEVAKVDMLENILGGFIFAGMRLGCTNDKEDLQPGFTKAVRLLLPQQEGEDITLEVWLHSSYGKCILVTNKISVEELSVLLGDYLFIAMKASKRRQREEATRKSSQTSAVEVLEDNSGDSKLRVMVNFDTGVGIWGTAFSPVS